MSPFSAFYNFYANTFPYKSTTNSRFSPNTADSSFPVFFFNIAIYRAGKKYIAVLVFSALVESQSEKCLGNHLQIKRMCQIVFPRWEMFLFKHTILDGFSIKTSKSEA